MRDEQTPARGEGPQVDAPWQLRQLFEGIEALRRHALAVEGRFREAVEAVRPEFRASARNLLHYLALRSYDLRELQEALEPLGLSSLGRVEAHTLASLDAVGRCLGGSLGREPNPASGSGETVDVRDGRRLIDEHAVALLGPAPAGESARIMVTLPSEAADGPELARALVVAGMQVARINCAHDTANEWSRMAGHVRAAAEELGRTCRVELDIAGPKLRTGALRPGPRVARWRPTRDARGRVVQPARLWLAPPSLPPPGDEPVDAWLPVEAAWLETVRPGDTIRLRDARGKRRKLAVVDDAGEGRWAECDRTGYVETGTALRLHGKGRSDGRIGELPPREQALLLRRGDRLVLTADGKPGRPARRGKNGALRPARIPCTLPEALARVRVGEPIKFDDGKIEGVAVEVGDGRVVVEITTALPQGSNLRGDKGINFPETDLQLAGLTAKDRADLDAVVELADIVGASFVNTPEDVFALQAELARRGASELGIMLKIETQRAFQELPWLMLAAMRSPAAGVMIARGDLAVECGWERLAEVQEEVLWLCEAAHLPVVWATQVLENQAKRGTPSRAEITDAARAHRAECVMLNKGPHVVEAMRTLHGILRRMQEHEQKRSPRLRRLQIAERARSGGRALAATRPADAP